MCTVLYYPFLQTDISWIKVKPPPPGDLSNLSGWLCETFHIPLGDLGDLSDLSGWLRRPLKFVLVTTPKDNGILYTYWFVIFCPLIICPHITIGHKKNCITALLFSFYQPSPVMHVFVVCVCACMRPYMWACVCVCVCVCDEMHVSIGLCVHSSLLWDWVS